MGGLSSRAPWLPRRSSKETSVSPILLGLALALGATADAAELHLRNGDRVTGEVILRADGKIHFRSVLLGDLIVPEIEATIIESVDVPVESLSGLPPTTKTTVTKVPPKAAVAPPTATKAPQAQPEKVAATQVPASKPAAAPAKPPAAPSTAKASPNQGKWRGKLELGFQQQSGRQDGVNASVRADAERERGRNQIKGNIRVLYGELNDRINTDRADASLRWRYQLSPRVFAQSLTSFLTDNVKQINQNYEQNAGFGYALIKRDRHVVNVGGGATGQYRDADNIGHGMAILGEVFQDYTYKINGRITLVQDFLAQYSPVTKDQFILRNGALVATSSDVENYRIRFNSTLQGRVTDRISMNLRFEYEFDNTVADRDNKTDQRISSSLGYAF